MWTLKVGGSCAGPLWPQVCTGVGWVCATLGSFEGRETARGKGGGELEGQACASRPPPPSPAQSYKTYIKTISRASKRQGWTITKASKSDIRRWAASASRPTVGGWMASASRPQNKYPLDATFHFPAFKGSGELPTKSFSKKYQRAVISIVLFHFTSDPEMRLKHLDLIGN